MAYGAWNFGDLSRGIYNSPEVERLQRALVALGYRAQNGGPLGVDGDFGTDTDTAVRAFQTAMGLRATGVVDNLTAQAIESAVDQGIMPGTGQSGGSVTIGPPEATALPRAAAKGSLSPLVVGGLVVVGLLFFMGGGSRRSRRR